MTMQEQASENSENQAKSSFLKLLLRVFGWVVLGLLSFLFIAMLIVYINRDEIKNIITTQISKQLNTEIKVGSIAIDFWDKFPQVAVKFSHVRAEEALPNPQQSLFLFKSIYVKFNIWDLLGSNYTIRQISFDDGEFNMRITPEGIENYIFWKTSDKESDANIELQSVEWNNTRLRYKDQSIELQLVVDIEKLTLKGKSNATNTTLNAEGKGTLYGLVYAKMVLADTVPVKMLSDIIYRNGITQISISKSFLADVSLEGQGTINDMGQQWKLKTPKNKIRHFLALVPNNYKPSIKPEQLSGEADMKIDISLSKKLTEVVATAQLYQAGFEDKRNNIYLSNITGAYLLNYKYAKQQSSGNMRLQNISAKTRTGNLKLNAHIQNFDKPQLSANGAIEIKVEELMAITRPGLVSQAHGDVYGAFDYQQKFNSWDEMTSKALTSPKLTGKLQVKNGELSFLNSNIKLTQISADLTMRNKDLVIERLFLREGKSEFLIDGWLYNALYMGPNRPTPMLSARLQSQNVDLNSILAWEFPRSADSGGSYTSSKTEPFAIDFSLAIDVKKFNLIRFTGYNLKAEIWNDQLTIKGKNVSLDGLKGQIAGNFSWAMLPNGYRFWTKANMKNIDINQLFGAFENFGQGWLLAENISGTGTADIETSIDLDKNYTPLPQSLKLVSDITILNGQLKGYKPLESLSSIVDKKALADVRFEKLQNQIAIANEVITIPQMEIKSTALNVLLQGRHSFDQQIDYSIRLAVKDLMNKKKKTKTDLDNWIVEVETADQPYIWIHVGCHIDDPCLSLDRELMKKGVKTEWQQQKQDVKNIFKPDATQNKPPTDPGKGTIIFEWDEDDDG